MAPTRNPAPALMICHFDTLTSNETDTVERERGQVRQRWGLGGGGEQVEVCASLCENLGKPEERQNVWMHLRTGRDKKGSWGARGLLLGLLIPRPSHPFRACLRSDSLALCVDEPAPPADLICYVFPLSPPPPTSPTVAPPQLSLSLSGTLAACFKEPAKGTFQAKAMSLDKGGNEGMKRV